MNKPKKISQKQIEGKVIIRGIHNIYWRGWNKCWDKLDKYHKQVLTELADEGKIHKIVNFATDEYINSLVDDDGVNIYIAKAISAMIRKSNSRKFIIDLAPATKKNSQRIFTKKTLTGKLVPFIVPSKRFKDYQAECTFYMPHTKTITTPINIKAIYYMPTRRVVDLPNLNGALHDILVHYRVIEDDNSKIVVSTDGSRVAYSKESPRTEVEITDSHEIMKQGMDEILPTKKKRMRRVLL